MKIKTLIILLAVTASAMAAGMYAYWDTSPVAEISFPMGNVFVIAKGHNKMAKAGFKEKLFAGDKVKTGPGARCEIKYKDASIVRIDAQSIYTINNAALTQKNKKVESSLSFGRLWANIKKLASSTDHWLLRGPSAVVAVRGTVYRMDVDKDSTSSVYVYNGSVNVAPPGWTPQGVKSGTSGNKLKKPHYVPGPTKVQGPHQVSLKEWVEIVKAQQRIVVKSDGSYQKADFDPKADAKSSWVQWNLERDKLLKR